MPRAACFQGRDFFIMAELFAAAAGIKHIAEAAFLAHAVRDREDDGQIAAVEDIVQDPALGAEQYEQKDEDPQAAVAAEISETVH